MADVVNRLLTLQPGNRTLIPGRVPYVSAVQNFRNGSETHPVSYSNDTRDSSVRDHAAVLEFHHSHSPKAEIMILPSS
jgi:hypothetical protein